jgi:hypothetical protein
MPTGKIGELIYLLFGRIDGTEGELAPTASRLGGGCSRVATVGADRLEACRLVQRDQERRYCGPHRQQRGATQAPLSEWLVPLG